MKKNGFLYNLTLNDMIQQGDIYMANLNPVKGHEQVGWRPVIVMQNTILNRNLNTVIVVPVTKNLQAKGLLTTFFLEKKVSRLPFDSVALLFQLRTLDAKRLKKRVAALPDDMMRQLKQQMWLVF